MPINFITAYYNGISKECYQKTPEEGSVMLSRASSASLNTVSNKLLYDMQGFSNKGLHTCGASENSPPKYRLSALCEKAKRKLITGLNIITYIRVKFARIYFKAKNIFWLFK